MMATNDEQTDGHPTEQDLQDAVTSARYQVDIREAIRVDHCYCDMTMHPPCRFCEGRG